MFHDSRAFRDGISATGNRWVEGEFYNSSGLFSPSNGWAVRVSAMGYRTGCSFMHSEIQKQLHGCIDSGILPGGYSYLIARHR